MVHRDMSDMTRIQLLKSDIVIEPKIFDTAALFFSAYIGSKQVNDENQKEMLKKAIGQAIDLALTTEKVVNRSSIWLEHGTC